MIRAKHIANLFLPVLVIVGLALLTGCENDLKDIQKISAAEVNKPIEKYTDVDVIYSDSAKVKAHMTAPVMINYKVKNPYTEMPKGVKVIFYDNDLQPKSTITANQGVYREKEKVIELHKNVVGTNAKGDTFSSEELIWDQNSKQIHSSQAVHVKLADGSITDGTSFVSDENFNHWTMQQGTGIIHVNSQDIGQ
ncbi:MAG: LPS export ABC transporter periplasmic protein LptC [Bacteroidetes bacterium]|jgi:LPS export ABC transporter protein LptC|nr:LPS export ABC transporter periplasmic protein LptC [Bacteroidota bacterium]